MTRLPSLARKLLLAAVFVLVLAGTASGTSSSAKLSARLTKTSFSSAQASSVKLVCKFKATSTSFGYAITIKSGKKWKTVKSVRKTGSFKGSYTKTVKQLFAGKAIKLGSYKLGLSADSGSKTLSFKVVKAPVGSTPVNTSLPTISGTVKQGQTLSASNGSWTGSPTAYAYRWDRCTASGAICADIGGATSSSYVLALGDVGSTIRVVVTASNSHGSASATSSQTAVVTGLPPANTSLPTISGTVTQGHTLTASNGSWSNSPTGYGYQWRRCNSSGASCSDISGAGSSAYALVLADADSTIRVVVTATNIWGSTSATSSQTVSVSGLVTGVSAGGSNSCALLSGGKVECWGANNLGQLGDGTTTDSGSPVVVSGIANATEIVTGYDHSCALLSDSTVKCWGYGGSGELGDGPSGVSAGSGYSTTPVQVLGSGGTGVLSGVTQLSAGQSHTCAVLSDNSAWCWGSDWSGELGDGPSGVSSAPGYSTTPVQVVGVGHSGMLSNVTQVSAGPEYSCANLSTGAVVCWGDSADGELGNGTSGSVNPTPVQVSGITSGATEVSAQGDHACAVVSGAVWCWGWGENGELGNNVGSNSNVPVQVLAIDGTDFLANATHIAVGSYFSCAMIFGGSVDCWGDGYSGQLGNGTWDSGAGSDIPVAVSGITGATQLSAGSQHACVLLPDHSIQCWGDNSDGQLGNGKFGVSNVPVTVSGAATTTQVSAGDDHTCAVHSDGALWCWGHNQDGQLGDGTTTNSPVPVQVKGPSGGSTTLTGVIQVSVGLTHTCAVVQGSSPPTDNTVWCWGWASEGELGNGSSSPSSLPVQVKVSVSGPAFSGATQVSAGNGDTCALVTDDTVWCWGDNLYGKLGDNESSPVNQQYPVHVVGYGGPPYLPNVTEVSASFNHTCAVSAGTVYCWGNGSNGKLGRGSTTDSHSPVPATGITTAVHVSAGEYDTCATTSTGTAWCWGYNINGALGSGSNSSTPAQVKGAGGLGSLANVADISAGEEHTCAHLTDNSVWCWGWDGVGQLGIGPLTNESYPTQVVGTGGVGMLASTLPVSAGGSHSCAIRSSDSAVVCWGSDYYGQLGDNGIALAPVPAAVIGLP